MRLKEGVTRQGGGARGIRGVFLCFLLNLCKMDQLNGSGPVVAALTPNDSSPQPGNEQDEQSM